MGTENRTAASEAFYRGHLATSCGQDCSHALTAFPCRKNSVRDAFPSLVMPRSIPSPTSEGSLSGDFDVGPTGTEGVNGNRSPSIWDAMLKNRSGSSAPSSPNSSKSPGVFGWLTGLGGGGSGGDAASESRDRIDAAAREHLSLPQLPTAEDRGEPRASPSHHARDDDDEGASTSDSSFREGEAATTPSKRGGGVARQLSSESATRPSEVPYIDSTPATQSVVDTARRVAEAAAAASSVAAQPSALEAHAPPGEQPPPCKPALLVGSCTECGEAITGAVFMLHDMPYCCQRHRLVAYHKMEREGKGGSSSPAAPPTSGLRAAYATWC